MKPARAKPTPFVLACPCSSILSLNTAEEYIGTRNQWWACCCTLIQIGAFVNVSVLQETKYGIFWYYACEYCDDNRELGNTAVIPRFWVILQSE